MASKAVLKTSSAMWHMMMHIHDEVRVGDG